MNVRLHISTIDLAKNIAEVSLMFPANMQALRDAGWTPPESAPKPFKVPEVTVEEHQTLDGRVVCTARYRSIIIGEDYEHGSAIDDTIKSLRHTCEMADRLVNWGRTQLAGLGFGSAARGDMRQMLYDFDFKGPGKP